MLGLSYIGQAYVGQSYPERSIVFDAASSSGYEASLSTYNWSHTCGLSARGLLVNVAVLATGSVSGITYSGVALAFVRADTSGVYRNEIWALEAPAAGAHSVTVTLSASLTSIASAASYGNIDQKNMVEATAGATGTGGTPTVAVVTNSPYAWTFTGLTTANATPTPGSSQTQRANNSGALGTGAVADKGPIQPVASTAGNWSAVGSLDAWALGIVALNPWEDTGVLARAFAEVLQLADSWARAAVVDARAFAEVFQLADTWAIFQTKARAFAENLLLTDSWGRSDLALRAFAESLLLADTWGRADVALRAFAELLQLADTWARAPLADARAFAEVLQLADSWARADVAVRAFAETFGLADTWARGVIDARAFAETFQLADSWGRVDRLPRAFAEVLQIADTWGRVAHYLRAFAETLPLTDTWGIAVHVLVVTGATLDQILDGTVSVTRDESWWFGAYDSSGTFLGRLMIDRDHPPTITNRPGSGIGRTISGLTVVPRRMGSPARDEKGRLWIYADDVDPLTMHVKAWWVLANTGDERQYGEFVFSDDVQEITTAGFPLHCTLDDLGQYLAEELPQNLSFGPGTLVVTAVGVIFDLAGIVARQIDASGAALSSTVGGTIEQDTFVTVLNRLLPVAGMLPVYFSNAGTAVCRAAPDLGTASATFKYGPGGIMVKGSILRARNRLKIPNRWRAIDTGSNNAARVGTFDIPAASPYSAANRKRVVTKTVRVPGLPANDQNAQDAAAKALYVGDAQKWATLFWSTPTDIRHDTYDVCSFDSANYIEHATTIVCKAGIPMTHEASGSLVPV